jgi:hypothetical protein
MPLSMPMEVMPTCTDERNWVGFSSSVQRGLRSLVPGFGHGRQAGLAAGGQRQLRHGEHAVEQGQQRNQQKIHGQNERINTMALYLIGDVQGCDAPWAACWMPWAFQPAATPPTCWATW